MTLLSMFLSPFNKLMITRYVGLEAVPVYEIGYRVAMQLRSLFQMSFSALLPEISRESGRHTLKALEHVRRLNRRSLGLILVYAFPGYLALMVVATPLLKVWLGENYVDAMSGVLRILLVSSFLTLLATPLYYALLGTGKVGICLFKSVLQSSLNVLVVMAFLFVGATLSVYSVAWAMLTGMAVADAYLIFQGRGFLRNISQPCGKSSVPVVWTAEG